MGISAPLVSNAHRTRAFHDNAGHQGARHDHQVPAWPGGPEIGPGRRAAPAALDGVLKPREALLPGAVEIRGDGVPGRPRRIQPGVPNGVLGPRELDGPGARAATIVIGAALPVLQALEVGKHMDEGPFGETPGRPTVVIGGVAAGVSHGVDGR